MIAITIGLLFCLSGLAAVIACLRRPKDGLTYEELQRYLESEQ